MIFETPKRTVAMGGARLLVVHNNPVIRSNLARLLEHAGYEVDAAADSEETLTKVRTAKGYDLIVMDTCLPTLSGFQVLEAFREGGFGNIPVVLLTSKSSPSEIARGHDKGALVFVQQPILEPALLNAVEYALQAHHTPSAKN